MNKMIKSSKYIKPLENTNEWKALSAYEKRTQDSEENKEFLKCSGQLLKKGFMWFAKEDSSAAKENASEKVENKNISSIQNKRSSKTKKKRFATRKPHDPRIQLIAEVLLRSAQENLNRIECALSTWGKDYPSEDITKAPVCKRTYPKRNVEKKCYKEEELSSEDEYLYCDDCGRDYKGACPEHGPMLLVCDNKAPKNAEERALRTLPSFLSIGRSYMPKAGLGVWTEVPLPKGMVFGPYQGHVTRDRKKVQDTGYAWQIREGSKTGHFIEAAAKNVSNWLRFVNCADREEMQNLMAFQYKRQIYYKTYKSVLPYTELLVWYGNNFASDLGIEVKDTIPIKPIEIDGYRCDVCFSLFSSEDILSKHKRHHPHMLHDRKHKCSQCSYSTIRTTDLQRHMVTHIGGERIYRCFQCPMSFYRDINLKRHLQRHTGERPFTCEICGRAFALRIGLRRHQRIHSGEKPYRCSTCGKDFRQLEHVRRHERAHIAQKPYRCVKCDYRAVRSSDLNTHIVQVHTKNFRHVCPDCGKGFLRPGLLRTHWVNKHSNEEIDTAQVKTEVNQEPKNDPKKLVIKLHHGKILKTIKQEPLDHPSPIKSRSSATQVRKPRFRRVTPREYAHRRLRPHVKYSYLFMFERFHHMECIEKSIKSKLSLM